MISAKKLVGSARVGTFGHGIIGVNRILQSANNSNSVSTRQIVLGSRYLCNSAPRQSNLNHIEPLQTSDNVNTRQRNSQLQLQSQSSKAFFGTRHHQLQNLRLAEICVNIVADGMRQRRWYSAEKSQPGAESGKEKDSAPPTKTTDAKDNLTTAQEQQVTKQSETKKSTLWDKVKHEARHYWDGTKLFGKELKISTKLVIKVLAGNKLTRRENRQLKRTLIDLVRLVPFSLFVIIPFAELLLPFALKIYPDLLPSTYEDKATKEKKAQQLTKIRNEMSVFLRGTIKEGLELKKKKELAEKQLIEAGQSTDTVVDVESIEPSFEDAERILTQLRSGKDVSNQDMMKLVKLLENNLTLDNLSRPQLISICRYLGIKSFGTDNYLKHQIQKRMQYILADDKLISSEGVETLTIPELQSACIARGIKSAGISPGKMREDLENWLDLHLVQKVPAVFLILSRILFRDTVNADLHHDALRVTLSSLPDNLVNEVTLSLAEREGTATNKQRLEVLEEQEELMEEETEQEQLKKP